MKLLVCLVMASLYTGCAHTKFTQEEIEEVRVRREEARMNRF